MNGNVGLESTLDKGSVFYFEVDLPVAEEANQPVLAPYDVSGSHILVIDDNDVNRAILQEQLQSWGFSVKTATSGEEGIALLKAAPSFGSAFDAVIMDYHMPGMNGIEAAKVIRADRDVCGTPIVMLTSVDQTNIAQTLSKVVIQGHLTKPAKASHLLETLVLALQADKVLQESISTEECSPQESAEVTLPSLSNEQAQGVDILIAEDNEVNKLVYGQIMSNLDYSYEVACNGVEAIEMMQSLKPRLIIMDVSMPEMNGLDATVKIREIESEAGTHTPIIGATAHAMSGDMEKCLDAGMDDYLPKPISPKLLTEKINSFLQSADVLKVRKS